MVLIAFPPRESARNIITGTQGASCTTGTSGTLEGSEPVLHAELQNTRRSDHRVRRSSRERLHSAECRRSVQVGSRITPVEVIQEVERLDAELEVLRRPKRDEL